MKKNKFKEHALDKGDFDQLAEEINTELSKPETEQKRGRIEKIVLEKIYPFYPEREITDDINKEWEKLKRTKEYKY